MINIGFIGLGNMGMHQVRSLAQVRGLRIAAGSDPADAAQKRFVEAYPDARVYGDHRQLLKDSAVDAVVVVSPTLYHKDIAIDAMKSGRHVMTEKPMARTVADCRRMIDVAEKTGKLLMVAHCRRYDADWGTFADIVKKGQLGRPIMWRHFMAGYGPGNSWFTDDKLGGGPMIDGAIHNQDFANMLFGEPQEVYASSLKLTETTCVDTATAVVRYASGDQLVLCWSWGAAPGASGLDALGTKGTVQFHPALTGDDIDTKKYVYYRVTDRKSRKQTIVRRPRKDMYVEQGKHFLACLQGKAECRSPGTESIKAVAVAEAILKAAPGGRIVKVRY